MVDKKIDWRRENLAAAPNTFPPRQTEPDDKYMVEKKFGWRREDVSAAPNAFPPGQGTLDDKSKDVPAADQPPTHPEGTLAEVEHAPKS